MPFKKIVGRVPSGRKRPKKKTNNGFKKVKKAKKLILPKVKTLLGRDNKHQTTKLQRLQLETESFQDRSPNPGKRKRTQVKVQHNFSVFGSRKTLHDLRWLDGSACSVYSPVHKGYVLGEIEQIQANGNTSVTVRSKTTTHHINDLRTAFEKQDRVKVNLHIDKRSARQKKGIRDLATMTVWEKYTGRVVRQVRSNTWTVRFEDDDQIINCDGTHMEHLAPGFVRVVGKKASPAKQAPTKKKKIQNTTEEESEE